MVTFYKIVENGIIEQVGWIRGRKPTGTVISEDEYKELSSIMKSMPTVPDGYGYRLKADLTWELYELPVVEEELTAEEALAIILGGDV